MPEAPEPDDAPVAWARCIVRDMTAEGDIHTKMTIDLAGTAKVASLVDEVARQTGYPPDKFLISLQMCAGGEELILNDYLNHCVAEVGLETGGQSRNKLIITDAKPRRKQRPARGLESGDYAGRTTSLETAEYAGRTSPVVPAAAGAEGGSDTAPAYTYASGMIKSNETGHVGLVNQAMTCYLNSLLQTLFMTPEFRNAMYSWEYEGTAEDSAKSIPFQLQKLFVNMQTTDRLSVETTELTYSFGWDSSEAWQQHDIQELCRVMFDALEVTFKNTEQHDLISKLYEGKMIDYVKCLDCGTEKDREDTYLDIPLPIRLFGATTAFSSVEEALRGFVKPEILDGNNQYHCDNCGRKCDAHKGLKFKTFPYLLTLHLKRFDFDYQTLHRIKLNDRVSFPEILNLNGFVCGAPGQPADGGDGCRCDDTSTTDSGAVLDDDTANSPAAENDTGQEDEGIDCSTDSETRANNWRNSVRGPYEYELFSIMIHAGSASGGHYYAYIKDFTKQEWFCFNDQSVSQVTQDDIRRTYGGGTRTSSYSSSTNAYMLMYRRIDQQQNKLPLTRDQFPEWIQKLLVRMREGEDEDRANKERERSMCKLTLFGVHPVLKKTVSTAFHVHKDMSLEDATELGWKMLEFNKHVPLARCRLVRYDELNDAIEESLEQQAGRTMEEVLGGVRSTYKLDLMLEWRAEDAQFEVYSAGDTTLQVLRVSVADGRVTGPSPLRASLAQSVSELRQALSLPETGRLCLARYCGDLRPLVNTERSLKLEGFHRNSRVFVSENDAEDAEQPFTASEFFCVCDRYEHTISLQVIVPNTDQETLDRLGIPSLDQMSISAALAAASAAAAAEPDSPPASPEPAGGDELLGGASSDQSASEDSSVTDSERTLIGDLAAGRASLPATPSNSPAGSDYQSMLSPQEEGVEGGDDDPPEAPFSAAAALEQPGQTAVRRYFAVEKSTPHENGFLWDVRLDNRITLGGFKKEIETLINVHRDYFKILKIYTSNQEFECTRLDDQLMTHGDNVTFVARLSRRLRDGELRGKVYKLEPNATEPSKFLFEWILRKGMSIEQAKRGILAELKSRLGADVPMNRCRLRKKSWKNPGKIYLDTYKFDEEVPLYPNWEIFLQELPAAEEVHRDGQLSVFCRRFHPSSYTLDDMHEVTLPEPTVAALLAALSARSAVPADNIRLAKPPGSFPNDFNALLAPTELDWLATVTGLDTWPLNILEDGYVLYYKDGAEPLAELTDQQRREISTRETARLQARSAHSSTVGSSSSAAAAAPRRERGLKIHVDIQPAAGD